MYFAGFYLPLNPSATTVYAWSAFYPSLRFTLSLQSAFYTQSAFYPWSALSSVKLKHRLSIFSLEYEIHNRVVNVDGPGQYKLGADGWFNSVLSFA